MAVPAIAPFLPLIGQGVNALSQVLTNSSQRNTNLQFYNTQRLDALADWNRQNEYNSPKAQMARFKEAGLNPHLIYGQTNTAAPVRSNTLDSPKYTAPSIDASAANFPMIAAQMGLLTAQTSNIQAQNDQRQLQNQFLSDTYTMRKEGIGLKNKLTEEQGYLTEEKNRQMDFLIDKLVAETDVSLAKLAQVKAITENYLTTQKILGYKVDTAKQEAEFVKQIQAIGIGGNALANILRTVKYLLK